jgi:beta-lactamase superfamily II metal-dependent hydrolase
MGYTKLKKLEVDFMQVAHHGSKNNTTDQLLELIACSDFIISADGINKHNLPHKETLARIIREKQKPVKFYFTHKNRVTESIFKVDNNPESMVLFPESGSNALVFKY